MAREVNQCVTEVGRVLAIGGEEPPLDFLCECGCDGRVSLSVLAPGKDWYDVVGTVTGDSSRAHARIPHDGFELKPARTGTYTWRAVVRLPRAGRWRLVVPNGTHVGFMTPPPSAWMPWVRVR